MSSNLQPETHAILARNKPNELIRLVIAIALHSPSLEEALELCTVLASHTNEHIRGNAILGFGHIARRFGTLPINPASSIIRSAQNDISEFVRGQAVASAEDIEQFAGWSVA